MEFKQSLGTKSNPLTALMESVPVVCITGEDRLVSVSPETDLCLLLVVLRENRISSAPVISAEGKGFGFVDMLDVIEYIIWTMKATKADVDADQFSDEMLSTKVSVLINFSRRDSYHFLSGADSLTSCLSVFNSGMIRHCAIGRELGDRAKIPLSICSPSDLIRFCSNELDEEGIEERLNVDSLYAMGQLKMMNLMERHSLCLIDQNATLLEACTFLIEKSCDVITIVDRGTNEFIGAFNPSHLEYWTSDDFHFFAKPVLEYLDFKGLDANESCIASVNVSLGEIISKMFTHKCKAIWILDDKRYPLTAVTEILLMKVIGSIEFP